MKIRVISKSKVEAEAGNKTWWKSHFMAPTVLKFNTFYRVYFGAWDTEGISRIHYIDVDLKNPKRVISYNEGSPCLDIGRDGFFDENGVFPAHVCRFQDKILLYYTGFQLGSKVRHYNFGGLAISENGKDFYRYSNAPLMDRNDEGLLVRAGQSVFVEDEEFHSVYSAGSAFCFVGGKQRPQYDVFYKRLKSPFEKFTEGKKIISANLELEHGLGRPQLLKLGNDYFVFYTRRNLNMKYFFGCSHSKDLQSWNQVDWSELVTHGDKGEFDSDMIYFPSVVEGDEYGQYHLFYSGNNFGEEGLGVITFCYED